MRKIKRRFLGRTGKETSSRKWREVYTNRLTDILVEPHFSSIEKAYSLTFTEANEQNYQDILRYIEKKSFFKMTFLKSRLPEYQDELGEYMGTNIFDIVLLIDKDGGYHLAIIYVQYVGDYKLSLKSVHKVPSFFYQMFEGRRLIFPV